jgi:hypothetical protein
LLNRLSKKWLLHFVGVCDQVTSATFSAAVPPDRGQAGTTKHELLTYH